MRRTVPAVLLAVLAGCSSRGPALPTPQAARSPGTATPIAVASAHPAPAHPARPTVATTPADWQKFAAPEFEAEFPAPFKVTPSAGEFCVSAQWNGQMFMAGWAQGSGPPSAVADRLRKAHFEVQSVTPIEGSGSQLQLRTPEGRTGQERVWASKGRLFQALWLGPGQPGPEVAHFWAAFKPSL